MGSGDGTGVRFRARVYLAGPFTQGDTCQNVANALRVAERLMERGYAPYVPHLNWLWGLAHQHEYEYWLALDKEWLAQCDAVYRIHGVSPGADEETALAHRLHIPVVSRLEHLDRMFGGDRDE